jgi:V/A-type H+-transporting ATPase subunit B
VRNLTAIIGEEELSVLDKNYLEFGDHFEADFLTQGEFEDRSIERTLEIGWKMLRYLPRDELYRVHAEFLDRYLGGP